MHCHLNSVQCSKRQLQFTLCLLSCKLCIRPWGRFSEEREEGRTMHCHIPNNKLKEIHQGDVKRKAGEMVRAWLYMQNT